jgi:hypothetical protein
MSPEPEHQASREEGYERRDANTRTLIGFGIGLAITLIVVIFVARWTFRFLAHEEPLGPPPTPFENARVLPPQPRLQVEPHMDLKTYCDQQLNNLNSYGWIDQQGGLVHIPVELAMDDALKQGFPTRPANESNGAARLAPVGSVKAPQPTGIGGPCSFISERSPAWPGK